MIDRKIAKIKLRRGFESERKGVIFEEGELFYLIDKKRLYIGDGTTLGGNPASNKNFVISVDAIPSTAIEGDLIYNRTADKTYILGYAAGDINKTNLIKFLIFTKSNYSDLDAKIVKLNDDLTILQSKIP